MGRRKACIGLVVWLAVGCADSEPDSSLERDGGIGGEGGGGTGGASGTGGAGGRDAGMGDEDASTSACWHALPKVHACVQGGGITVVGEAETHVELTGTVERLENASFGCIAEDAARVFGILGTNEQTYVIRDGDESIELTIATGSERALLNVGQRVRVAVDDVPSGSTLPDGAVLSVENAADGRILYWFTRTQSGFEGLALPPGFSASNVAPECAFEWQCGVQYRRDVALLTDDEHVPVAIGDLTRIGELEALVIDNTEQVQGADGSCFDAASYHRVSIALFDRELIGRCDWRDEASCADDDCRDVRATLVGYSDQRFIACVQDDSCSDGDVTTCGRNDATDQLAVFSTNCVPPGWSEAYGACDPDADAGSEP